jgi:hypothetical protein
VLPDKDDHLLRLSRDELKATLAIAAEIRWASMLGGEACANIIEALRIMDEADQAISLNGATLAYYRRAALLNAVINSAQASR